MVLTKVELETILKEDLGINIEATVINAQMIYPKRMNLTSCGLCKDSYGQE